MPSSSLLCPGLVGFFLRFPGCSNHTQSHIQLPRFLSLAVGRCSSSLNQCRTNSSPRQALDLPLDRTLPQSSSPNPTIRESTRFVGHFFRHARRLLLNSVDLDDSGAFPEVCSYHTVENPGLTLEHNSSFGQQNQHAHTFACLLSGVSSSSHSVLVAEDFSSSHTPRNRIGHRKLDIPAATAAEALDLGRRRRFTHRHARTTPKKELCVLLLPPRMMMMMVM